MTCRGVGVFTAVDTQSLVGFRKNRKEGGWVGSH